MTGRNCGDVVGSTGHFSDLDGMRGLLATIVMFYHFGLNTVIERAIGIEHIKWDACVDFFFVLSGLVLSRSLEGRHTSLVGFVSRRFWRLFPLHLAVTILFFPVLFSAVPGQQILLDGSALSPLLGLKMANHPAWSMGFEFYLPIVMTALLLAVPAVVRLRHALLLGFFAAMIGASVALGQGSRVEWTRAVSGLGTGYMLWLVLSRDLSGFATRLPSALFTAMAAAFLAVVFLAGAVADLAAAIPVTIVLAVFVGTRTRGLFSTAPLRWLGRLSFGIYMVHVPVLVAFEAVLGAEALRGNVLLKALIIAVTLLAAEILHRVVEIKGVSLGRRIGGRTAGSVSKS